MNDYTFHEFAGIVEMMNQAAFEELTEDIRRHGLHEPIVLLDGLILDGRNRYRACRRAGVEPTFVDFDQAWGDPLDYVVSVNLKRRHLDASQRAMGAERAAHLKQGRPKTGPGTGFSNPGATQAQTAVMFEVSESSVRRARRIREQGTPELIAAVERGEISLRDALGVVKYEPDVQDAALAAKKSGQAKTVKEAARREAAKRRAEAQGNGALGGEEPVRDQLGNEVPPECRRAFAQCDAFRALGRQFDGLKSRIEVLAREDGGDYLRLELGGIVADVQHIKRRLLDSMPHSVQPGKPNPPKWLSRYAYKQQQGLRS